MVHLAQKEILVLPKKTRLLFQSTYRYHVQSETAWYIVKQILLRRCILPRRRVNIQFDETIR